MCLINVLIFKITLPNKFWYLPLFSNCQPRGNETGHISFHIDACVEKNKNHMINFVNTDTYYYVNHETWLLYLKKKSWNVTIFIVILFTK